MVCSKEHDRACGWFEGSFDRWLGLVDQPASERGWGLQAEQQLLTHLTSAQHCSAYFETLS
jgi:hypothetical protein